MKITISKDDVELAVKKMLKDKMDLSPNGENFIDKLEMTFYTENADNENCIFEIECDSFWIVLEQN